MQVSYYFKLFDQPKWVSYLDAVMMEVLTWSKAVCRKKLTNIVSKDITFSSKVVEKHHWCHWSFNHWSRQTGFEFSQQEREKDGRQNERNDNENHTEDFWKIMCVYEGTLYTRTEYLVSSATYKTFWNSKVRWTCSYQFITTLASHDPGVKLLYANQSYDKRLTKANNVFFRCFTFFSVIINWKWAFEVEY